MKSGVRLSYDGLTITIRMTCRSAIAAVMAMPGGENPGNITHIRVSLGRQSVSKFHHRKGMILMAHTRYLLSLDPALEVGWVYRAEPTQPADDDRWNLFNELSTQSTQPAYSCVPLSHCRIVDLPADIYAQVIQLQESGHAIGAEEADRLLAPFRDEDPSCYLIRMVSGDSLWDEAMTDPPFGPGFHATDLEGIQSLEIWGSRFSAPEDFVEYRLMRNGVVVKRRRFAGY